MPDLHRYRTVDPDPRAVELKDELRTPETVVESLYELLSGPAEEQRERDWDRFRALALPDARFLIAHGWDEEGRRTVSLRQWDMDRFIADAKEAYRSEGFWEREVWGRTEQFGGIAHRLSTYASRVGSEDSEPVAHGINSIQLVRFEDRWWIASVIWDHQTPEQPIPPEYLDS